MSYRGRGGGRGRGGFRGGGGRGRGGFNRSSYDEIPDCVVEVGTVMHPCQEELVCKCTNPKVNSIIDVGPYVHCLHLFIV